MRIKKSKLRIFFDASVLAAMMFAQEGLDFGDFFGSTNNMEEPKESTGRIPEQSETEIESNKKVA